MTAPSACQDRNRDSLDQDDPPPTLPSLYEPVPTVALKGHLMLSSPVVAHPASPRRSSNQPSGPNIHTVPRSCLMWSSCPVSA